jgi:fucose permease
MLIGIALLGGMLAPWITGLLVESIGITRAFGLPCLGFLAVLVMQTLARRTRHRER